MAVEILIGDWVEQLKTLPSDHFHCAVTSPPYWGLRNYGVEGQLGLEKTPEEYVQKLVGGFRELKRTLRDDGTLWLNLGDSYLSSGGNTRGHGPNALCGNTIANAVPQVNYGPREKQDGLKAKDIVGIPWMVAFALRADGWYLRQWMPWVKRNPMPESVTDRPGTACETVFLLAKSADYFYDAEAVKMDGKIPAGTRGAKGSEERSATNGVNSRPPEYKVYSGKRNRRSSDNFWDTWQGLMTDEGGDPVAMVVNTYPYKKAHFATFPPKLVEPIVRCATSEKGCCYECGAPMKRELAVVGEVSNGFPRKRADAPGSLLSSTSAFRGNPTPIMGTLGFTPSCECCFEDFNKPCRVIDPFGGSGTTGMVCRQYGRDCTLIELNPDYAVLAKERCGV